MGSPDLPFVLNQSMSFLGVFKLWDLYVDAFYVFILYVRVFYYSFFFFCAGKSRRCKLVNWVEKASF